MDRAEKEALVYGVFQEIAGGYDRANDRISLGQHRRWKRMLTDRLVNTLPPGAEVLDMCCGTGDIALELAERRGDLRILGLDFSPAMLEEAGRRRGERDQPVFRQGSALEIPAGDGRFAAACVSFGLRNTADYRRALEELGRVTAPGGCVYCLDSFVPEGRWIRPFYRLYFEGIMPLLGGGRRHGASYRWLCDSTKQFLSREGLEALFRAVGFEDVRSEGRMFGACCLIRGRVPEDRPPAGAEAGGPVRGTNIRGGAI